MVNQFLQNADRDCREQAAAMLTKLAHLSGKLSAIARGCRTKSDVDGFIAVSAAHAVLARMVLAVVADTLGREQRAGAYSFIGRKFIGVRGERITITEAGLAAAAHRGGAPRVMEYLRDLHSRNSETNAWRSYREGLTAREIERYDEIEARLREFERARYRRLHRIPDRN